VISCLSYGVGFRQQHLRTRRHSLGQHFLVSEDVCDQIVSAASPNKNDIVLEIGTGKGTLTEKLAPFASKIISFEKDLSLLESARYKLACLKNVSLIGADVFDSAHSKVWFDLCVTSLPYSRSLDFVEWLAFRSGTFRAAVAILQLDFASKLLARPSERYYRSVSVIGQISFEMELIGLVDRTSFEPPPRVQSAIVRFKPNGRFPQPFFDRKRITTLRNLFSFKGRMLRNALKAIGFNPVADSIILRWLSTRVEELSPDHFASILNEV
jgi:16S rRNA (adenine1518-N6/adenine1519-N6)-dimethyltransferase